MKSQFVFALPFLLCACLSQPRMMKRPPDKRFIRRQEKVKPTEKNNIYTKRTSPNIILNQPKSETGSLFHESTKPLNLYAQNSNPAIGDPVNIRIPKHLQFKPEKHDRKKKQEEKKRDVYLFSNETEIPAQIVSLSPDGSALIRGGKSYTNQFGDTYTLTFFAKIPKPYVNKKDIAANLLQDIQILEERPQLEPTEYKTSGWDRIATRKISGFLPDLDSEFEELKTKKTELDRKKEELLKLEKEIARNKAKLNNPSNRGGESTQAASRDRDANPTNTPSGAPMTNDSNNPDRNRTQGAQE